MQSPWLQRWCLMGAPHTPGPLKTLSGKVPEHSTDSSLSTSPGCLQKETNVHMNVITTRISRTMKGIMVTKQPELGSETWATSSRSARTRHVLWCNRASLCIWICLEQWSMRITCFPTCINTLEYSSQLWCRKIYIQLVPQGSFKEQNPPKMREIYSSKKSSVLLLNLYDDQNHTHGYTLKVSVIVESSRQCAQLISHHWKQKTQQFQMHDHV